MADVYTATAEQVADALELEASCLLDELARPLGNYQSSGEEAAKVLHQAALIMRLFGSEYEL